MGRGLGVGVGGMITDGGLMLGRCLLAMAVDGLVGRYKDRYVGKFVCTVSTKKNKM